MSHWKLKKNPWKFLKNFPKKIEKKIFENFKEFSSGNFKEFPPGNSEVCLPKTSLKFPLEIPNILILEICKNIPLGIPNNLPWNFRRKFK